ncbi:MAG: hypothetical protein F4123_08540 [Gemmatimonadetes bacterium]|nr:hypothetical protein [Gemmatimonadota bacterium]MYB97782.1 hypothetical protein [Gemmatimonadota bacterium]MYI46401.1 hypothetical protein [Gemmatimonadota bacterium]
MVYMKMIARLAGAAAFTLVAVPASAQEECDDWNTSDFFYRATAETVAACLEAGADLDARHDRDRDSPDDGNTPLHFASRYAWEPAVFVVLLEAGADVEARNRWGRTPLHGAAGSNRSQFVAELARAGADLNARDSAGNTPLHATRYNEHVSVVYLLLELGADPTLVNDRGEVADPLDCGYWNTQWFARVATAQATAACLAAGADVNARDRHGNMPLLFATEMMGGGADESPASKDPSVVTLLLEAGAEVNAHNELRSTPLHNAAWGKRVEVWTNSADLVENPPIVAALLAAGADVSARDNGGSTPLHHAAAIEGLHTVAMLLEAGADIHARDNAGYSPLLRSANFGFGDLEILETLVAAGADVNDQNEYGISVLLSVLRYGTDKTVDVVRRLLDLGADVNAPGLLFPVLDAAARQGDNPELIAVLLEAGADANPAPGRSSLHAAARGGGPGAIAALVAAGAEVDEQYRGGPTPLHGAVEAKKPANVTALLKAGADVHLQTQDGNTPLHLAAVWPGSFSRRDDPPDPADTLMVIALAAAGADVNARNHRGETPLHIATRNRHQPVVDKLLALGADPRAMDNLGRAPRPTVCDWTYSLFFTRAPWESVIGCLRAGADVHARNEYGEPPLYRLMSLAARYDYPLTRVIAAFVEAGADVNAPDRRGGTPLHDVADRGGRSGGPRGARALLDAGADVNARDTLGTTPLHRAASAAWPDNDSLVSLLVEAGADLHATDDAGRTALHHALRSDNPATAARLIELGSDTDARDDSGYVANPLDCARFNTATFFHLAPTETVVGCIEGGADVKARFDYDADGNQPDGSTPLHFASAWARDPAIVSLLVQAGADVNARDGSGGSPLHSAAQSTDNPAMIVALIDAGAELDVWTGRGYHGDDGMTPLHVAAASGHASVVATLITAGADVHARDREDGPTPLHDATTPEIVALLLEAGADIGARAVYYRWPNPRGRDVTPLHAAVIRANPAVFMALLEAGADPEALDWDGKTPMDHARERKELQELEVVKRSGR